ncbi:type I restriction endonuclease subunit M [Aromatoleum toluvorans]|uniref:Type I restriction endonuclease subunit M n=2 Tax=Aromatoleum toluvorans TaxID=92002 RepID=A0ABX1PSW5_9RHOO|nr:type I restriction endonuclease subunit M [Aromatoleum toluvorans]
MTPGVEDLLDMFPQLINRCLAAYTRGDWGVSADRELNDEAVKSGEGRILAAYPIDPARPSRGYGENTVWVITEADRSVTTLLLPEEY